MQEHDVLYADRDEQCPLSGDAAHGMVLTLGQGATQAIEDACFAAQVLARRLGGGANNIRECIDDISRGRSERLRFVMEFSSAATDTMLAAADPVAGTLHKTEPDFLAKLKRLYRDVPVPPVSSVSPYPSETIA